MRKIKFFTFCICVSVGSMLYSCRGKQVVNDSYSYRTFETSIVNVSPSGDITVRAWGNGPDKKSAIETAKKNAVSDVIFKGIKGAKGVSAQPIVTEVNARERYAEYFDSFFADGGKFANFVREASSSDKSRTQSKSNGRVNFGLTVEIKRPALVRQLSDNGIINGK